MIDTIDIAIADDQLLFRRGIRSILASTHRFNVAIEAENGQDLLEKLHSNKAKVSVLLLDLEMPIMNGVECIKEINQHFKDLKTVILSVHNQPAYVARLVELGARAYLQKNAEPEMVIHTIHRVHETGFYLDEQTMLAMREGLVSPHKKITFGNDHLTAREQEILRLICDQCTTPEIANKLFISERTVDGHRNNLLQKTGCRNVAGLAVFAIQNGFYKVV
jgi:DNA-binding NarL/FixJ family response regulator